MDNLRVVVRTHSGVVAHFREVTPAGRDFATRRDLYPLELSIIGRDFSWPVSEANIRLILELSSNMQPDS